MSSQAHFQEVEVQSAETAFVRNSVVMHQSGCRPRVGSNSVIDKLVGHGLAGRLSRMPAERPYIYSSKPFLLFIRCLFSLWKRPTINGHICTYFPLLLYFFSLSVNRVWNTVTRAAGCWTCTDGLHGLYARVARRDFPSVIKEGERKRKEGKKRRGERKKNRKKKKPRAAKTTPFVCCFPVQCQPNARPFESGQNLNTFRRSSQQESSIT